MFAWFNSSRQETVSTTHTFGAPTCVTPPQMGKRKLIRLVRLLQTGNRKFVRLAQFFQAGNCKFLCLAQRLRGVGQALNRIEELIDRIPVWGSYFLPALKVKSPGSIFVPCMISGLSMRKGDLPGKILTPCIQNHPIAPGNGRIGRGSCHSDLEKHTFRANIARKRAYCVHSSKRERIRRDSCQAMP